MLLVFKSRTFLLFILLIVLPFFTTSFADETYKSGQSLALENAKLVKLENGFFVGVPIDYQVPSKGLTQIYAHFAKPYNPKLPTVINFDGGPGQNSHATEGPKDLFANLDYNLLLFDQRGIAFSRPDSEKVWRDPDFYSSENTARDAEELRRALGIKKMSLFGVSYGTAPATIFAHLFPHATLTVVLEGTIHSNIDHSKYDHLRGVVQKYFNSFSPELKEKIITISRDVDVGLSWYPEFVRWLMGFHGQHILPKYTPGLENAAKLSRDEFKQKLIDAQYLDASSDVVKLGETEPMFSVDALDPVANEILLFKEFGIFETGAAHELILDNGNVKWLLQGEDNFYAQRARRYREPFSAADRFWAAKYPTSAPVYYLHGTSDPQVQSREAVEHWKAVPQSEGYLILLVGGGHEVLTYLKERAPEFLTSVFPKMLEGSPLSNEDFAPFRQQKDLKLVFKKKDNSETRSCAELISEVKWNWSKHHLQQ